MIDVTEEDVALRLVHTADWHLGRTFESFGEENARTLARARLDVLDDVFGVAERERAHAVLCAGDLFDDIDPGETWWRPLAQKLDALRWTDRPVLLLPGNHDPLMRGSVWDPSHRFRQSLPDFVHVVDRDDFELALSDEAVLYARPCRSRSSSEDHVLALPAREPDDPRIRIGLVHGVTFDVPGHQTNFPIAQDAAAQRGLDYLALGDTHGFRNVASAGKPPMIYPGAPEQTAFDEREAGHCAVVLVTRARRVHVHPHRVGRWHWRSETVGDLDGLRKLRDDSSLRQAVLDLTVAGAFTPADYDEAERILDELAGTLSTHGKAGILRLDRGEMRVDATDAETAFANMPEELQVAARLLRGRVDEHGEAANRALVELLRLARKAG